jgi:mannobiose 2-epimerase
MNTHLHVLEGFSNLYRACIDENLLKKISELIDVFINYIIDPETHHLILFFDEKWNKRSKIFSYGHDIEAAWLLLESTELTSDKFLIEKVKAQSVLLANAAAEGLDKDGGLWYEFDKEKNYLVKEKHSWPQAEAMIGFFNSWQITGDEKYFHQSLKSWEFIKEYMKDGINGEWFWGRDEDYEIMDEDKAGMWKGPYHSSRACMELIKRITKIES